MTERAIVVWAWPKPVTVQDRWVAARLRVALWAVYGRPGDRRRIRRRIGRADY
ncbi:hypothetical protein ACTD5D_39940 [Nocardia takedensis]|uniref:hypothetical protein n=1 Tax=Nocardia takedensis TaxID=259390 RepID=UPI003F75E70F